MKIVRIAIVALAVLAAPVLLLQGMSNARIVPGPANWNGFWIADVSRAFVQLDTEGGGLSLTVNETGREFAQNAFAVEPYASDAIFTLAIDAASQGRAEESSRLTQLGIGLDKRNRRLGLLELQDALGRGELDTVFAALDRMSITNPSLVRDFVRPLAASLEQANALPELRDALDADPVWADEFWQIIPESRDGLIGMSELRRMADSGVTRGSDALLLAGLVSEGLFEESTIVWESLSDDVGAFAFQNSSDFPPIGWQLTNTGSRSLSSRDGGNFEAYVEGQTYGELARQLVRLPAGEYRFNVQVSPQTVAERFSVSLQCASDGEFDEAASRALSAEATWSVGSECDVYWLVLSGSAWEQRTALRATLSDMEFIDN